MEFIASVFNLIGVVWAKIPTWGQYAAGILAISGVVFGAYKLVRSVLRKASDWIERLWPWRKRWHSAPGPALLSFSAVSRLSPKRARLTMKIDRLLQRSWICVRRVPPHEGRVGLDKLARLLLNVSVDIGGGQVRAVCCGMCSNNRY